MSDYTILPSPWLASPSEKYPYYVYELIRPDDRVFYVGKGKDKRIYEHAKEAQKGCACHKCRVIRKIWSEGGGIIGQYVFVTNNETEAYRFEARLIAYYGIKNLTNARDHDPRIHIIRPPAKPTKEQREIERLRKERHAEKMIAILFSQLRCARGPQNKERKERILRDMEMYKRVVDPLEQNGSKAFN